MLTGFAFWLMRWYASTRAGLMKQEIGKHLLIRRVRISLLSPLLYLTGAVISLVYPFFALCLYAVIPAYFALGTFGRSESNAA